MARKQVVQQEEVEVLPPAKSGKGKPPIEKKAPPSKSRDVAVSRGGSVVNQRDIEERLAKLAAEAVEQEESVTSGSFITFKAGVMEFAGNPVAGNNMDVVIVDAIMENCYYPGKFDAKEKRPPICYAFGRDDKELAPHPESAEPQSKLCKDCEHNKFGTADEGRGDGKACKNIRRIAMIPADAIGSYEDVIKAEIAMAKIPVTSVKGWAAYVKTLNALQKKPPQAVVTNLACAPDPKTQVKVTFSHVDNLKAGTIGAILDKKDAIQEQLTAAYPEQPEEEEAPPPRARKGANGKAKPEGRRRY